MVFKIKTNILFLFLMVMLVLNNYQFVLGADLYRELAVVGDNVQIENGISDQKIDDSFNLKAAESVLNPLKLKSPNDLIGRIARIAISIIGSVSLAMFIYGGLLWMFSQGQEDKETKAKNILIWTSLGLVLIFSAYALVRFIFDIF